MFTPEEIRESLARTKKTNGKKWHPTSPTLEPHFITRPQLTKKQSQTLHVKQYNNPEPPYFEPLGYVVRCKTCNLNQPKPTPTKCKDCTIKQVNHRLAKAYNATYKSALRNFQPHHTTFTAFVHAPFLPPLELHPDHRAFRIAQRENPDLTMLDFLNITPPPIPANAHPDYELDLMGFSYPQWLVFQAHPNTDPKRLLKAVRAMSHSHTIEDHHAPNDSRWDKTQSFANYCKQTVDSQEHTR